MKTFFITLIAVFLTADLFIWWRGVAALRKARAPRWLRLAFGLLVASQMLLLMLQMQGRMGGLSLDKIVPMSAQVFLYLWHIVVVLTAVIWLICSVLSGIVRFVRNRRENTSLSLRSLPMIEAPRFTRRQFLSLTAALTPPFLAFGFSGIARFQLTQFRTRRFVIDLPQLPPALDGITLVHLTDTHVGRFTNGELLTRVADATNALKADLVIFTGDLLNDSMAWLPEAKAMLQQIKQTVYLCEGNHDLIDDAQAFRKAMREIPNVLFLMDDAHTISLRGTPVQLLGSGWSRTDAPERTRQLMLRRDPRAFGIHLIHHPHVWDHTTEIPLTLAGHTHGGQIMATKTIGFGPMMYRYWSGLYTRPATEQTPKQALVVSNGVGNWFPIRVEAPAEIVHITLRKG